MRQLFVRVGFSDPAAHALVEAQGLDSLDNLRMLQEDDCTTVCKNVRRPGGTINNNDGNPVPNPGTNVSLVAEKQLKLTVYFLKHRQRCSRTTDFKYVTLERVRAMQTLHDMEKQHKDPETADPTKIISAKDWTKTFETIDEYIGKHNGVRGVPLTYVVRPDVAPAPAPADGFATDRDEMIARAPHFILDAAGVATAEHTTEYQQDNMTVWNLMSALARNQGDCWTYVKTGQRRKDGRTAYLAMKQHYLGAHNMELQKTLHESKLRSLEYTGEKRRQNFATYATRVYESVEH